jgi:hypothetical protein
MVSYFAGDFHCGGLPVMGYIRTREPEVPPLPGLSCRYRFCFPRFPPWAMLWCPSGTPGNMKLVHYRIASPLVLASRLG